MKEDEEVGSEEAAEHVPNSSQEAAEHVPLDASQDGGECSSDSDGLDANKLFKDWQELQDGHKLER